ncbi:MAG: hypothetical protein ACQCN5_14160 [Candidatus Bathyarchaeia archaeon]|jgi:hypothetical protein
MLNLQKDLERYNNIKRRAFKAEKENKFEKALDYAWVAATFATFVHLGVWFDNEIEDLLKKVGQEIGRQIDQKPLNNSGNHRIVHVLTSFSGIGGHYKVAENWIEALDGHCQQFLYMVGETNQHSSDWTKRFGNKVTVRYASSKLQVNRVKQLIEILERDKPEKIVLYIHPSDVATVTAINGLKNKPHVIFFNHFDHFWVGRNIVDQLIEWRQESLKYTKKYRQLDVMSVIPLTIDVKKITYDKAIVKKELHIPSEATVSVTVAKKEKVVGDKNWDYYETIKDILMQNPNHYHISVSTPQKPLNNPDLDKRFITIPRTSQVSYYYSAADFLIESFPAIGGTVLTEAMAYKLPILKINNKQFSLYSSSDALPENYPIQASSKEEVIKQAKQLIIDSNLRAKLSSDVLLDFNSFFDFEKIRKIIVETVLHSAPSKLEIADCSYDVEYLYSVSKIASQFSPSREAISYASKKPAFSLLERIAFYRDGAKNGEFTLRMKIKELALAFMGYKTRAFVSKFFKRF